MSPTGWYFGKSETLVASLVNVSFVCITFTLVKIIVDSIVMESEMG